MIHSGRNQKPCSTAWDGVPPQAFSICRKRWFRKERIFAGKTPEQQTAAWERFTALARAGKVVSAWAVENGLAEAVMKMSFGNEIGFAAENTVLDWFAPMPGAIVAELSDEVSDAVRIGVTTAEKAIALGADSASIEELAALNDAVLEAVYPTKTRDSGTVESFSHETKTRVAPAVKQVRPKALIPVFPGTNCEYDTQRALSEAGADAEQFILTGKPSTLSHNGLPWCFL